MRSTFLINEIHKKHLLNVISNIFCNLARAYSWWGENRNESVKLRKLATASFKSWLPYSTLWVTQVLLSDNLGQNKMEQQTPIPPKSRMKPREGQKRAIFPSLIWGGGGSRFSIYFVQDCRWSSVDHVTSKFHPLHLSTHDNRHDASCPAVAVFPHSLVPRARVIGMKCKNRLRKIP